MSNRTQRQRQIARAWGENYRRANIIRDLGCILAGHPDHRCRGQIQACHARARGMGNAKGDYRVLFGACPPIHEEYGEFGTPARDAAIAKYGIDPLQWAEERAAEVDLWAPEPCWYCGASRGHAPLCKGAPVGYVANRWTTRSKEDAAYWRGEGFAVHRVEFRVPGPGGGIVVPQWCITPGPRVSSAVEESPSRREESGGVAEAGSTPAGSTASGQPTAGGRARRERVPSDPVAANLEPGSAKETSNAAGAHPDREDKGVGVHGRGGLAAEWGAGADPLEPAGQRKESVEATGDDSRDSSVESAGHFGARGSGSTPDGGSAPSSGDAQSPSAPTDIGSGTDTGPAERRAGEGPATFTTKEAAAYLGMSSRTLDNLRSQGRGPDFSRLPKGRGPGPRRIQYTRTALDTWRAGQRCPTCGQRIPEARRVG